jgi:hypothetical protein
VNVATGTAAAHPVIATEQSASRVSSAVAGALLFVGAFIVFLLSSRMFDAGRGDFFYLADAVLKGRTWFTPALGPYDDVIVAGKVYVPFAPFPAILLLPLVAAVGPHLADTWQPIINSGLAAFDVWLLWVLAGRLGVRNPWDRLWLAVLFGFSTAIWWVTTRGGVWHTGHLVATMLTLLALIELFGRRRALIVGLLGGAAFLTRAPVVFAMPAYGLWYLLDRDGRLRDGLGRGRRAAEGAAEQVVDGATSSAGRARRFVAALPIRDWVLLTIGFLPAFLFWAWYNQIRFGSPLESGYGLATLPLFLEQQRDQGLFSLSHLGMNINYLFLDLPKQIPDFPFFRPDGFGLSIFLTSPALLLAFRANWRSARSWLLAFATVATIIPSLLYYGGGWLQYGYRYALDSIPFVMALACIAAARHGVNWFWRALIVFGVIVNLGGVYWAYNLS